MNNLLLVAMFVMSIIFVQAEEGVIYKTWTEMSQLEGDAPVEAGYFDVTPGFG